MCCACPEYSQRRVHPAEESVVKRIQSELVPFHPVWIIAS
jgi:hypothetical protein